MTRRPRRAPARDAGFSLLEVLVALAVFSLGVLALMNVLGEGHRALRAGEARALAQIVAENQLVDMMAARQPPAPGETSGRETVLGRDWIWTMNIAPTSEAGLLRVDVRVRGEDSAQTVAELTTFRSAR